MHLLTSSDALFLTWKRWLMRQAQIISAPCTRLAWQRPGGKRGRFGCTHHWARVVLEIASSSGNRASN
jgi:hypothetical protein